VPVVFLMFARIRQKTGWPFVHFSSVRSASRVKRRLRAFEALEPRLAMIAEGSSYAIDITLDTSAILGAISAEADWGDGSKTALAVASTPAVGPLKVRFDYSLDSSNYFNSQEKRDILQVAADMVFSRFSDSLDAITPSGTNTWTAVFPHPTTGALVNTNIGSVAANELVIFVGARALAGNALALAGGGGLAWRGTSAWGNTVTARGQVGGLGATPTDFGPWGGSLTVDSNTKWHFGATTQGLDSDEYDFLTAISHEFIHVIGFGISPSWNRLAASGQFFGPASISKYNGQPVPLSGSLDHWREGIVSQGLETLMDPTIESPGSRKLPTPLDLAGLVDIGWNLIAQQTRVSGSHTYGDDGTYLAQVILTGSRAGSRSTPIENVAVTNVAPTLNPQSNISQQVNVPFSLVDLGVFQDVGFGPSETFQFEIDWGDSSPKSVGAATIDQLGGPGVLTRGSFDGAHTYTQPGNYTVRYRVSDDNGGSAEQTLNIQATPAPELLLSIDRNEFREDAGSNAANLKIDAVGFDTSQPITVQLTNSDPTGVSLVGSVTIPAGSTSVTIGVSAVDDTLLDGTQTVQLSARFGSIESQPISIRVLDHETVTVQLNVTQVREDAGPGAAVLRVSRSNTDLSSPLDVQLTSSDTNTASVPLSITIPAGASSLDVSVSAIDNSIVQGNRIVLLSAAAANYFGSSASLTVLDYEPLQWVEQQLVLAESPSNPSSSITIQLPVPAPSSGITIDLSADDPTQLRFPAQITIPAGQTSASILISAINDDIVESPKVVKFFASSPGYTSASISVTVTDDDRSIWTNSANVYDVNGDGSVDSTDVLQVINFIRRFGQSALPSIREPLGPPFIDTNGNGVADPQDILVVINFMRRRAREVSPILITP